MKDGELVWFGSDCSKYADRTFGIWDQDSFALGEMLGGLSFQMSKAQRLDYRDSAMNHAMVLTGVNLDASGKPNRWKIENSWGKDAGEDGYYVGSAEWFDRYVTEIIINKKYLDEATLAVASQEPVMLEPWEPLTKRCR